jgi:non-specific serine/threonine protein kinase
LNGLATPGDGAGATAATYPAVQFFTARAAQFGGTVTEADLSVIAQICRLLDGLPRSIELAAALTVSHSCRAIVELVAPASR